MWQCSHNVLVTQSESGTQNKMMSKVEHISDTEEVVEGSWSLVQNGITAVSESLERLPLP